MPEMVRFASTLDVKVDARFYAGGQHFSTVLPGGIDYDFEILDPDDPLYSEVLVLTAPKFDSDDHRRTFAARVPFILELSPEYIGATNDDNMARAVARFLNRHLAIVERIRLEFGLPRFRLDGRALVAYEMDHWRAVAYRPWTAQIDEIVHEIFDEYAGRRIGCAHVDFAEVLSDYPDDDQEDDLAWVVLAEAIRHFSDGSFREAVINSCSAAEVLVSPAVEKWLAQQTVTAARGLVENACREMGNPLRFEVYIHTVNRGAFSIYTSADREGLLRSLKSMNAIRNKVVHELYRPSEAETLAAILSAGRLVRASWIELHREFFEYLPRYEKDLRSPPVESPG